MAAGLAIVTSTARPAARVVRETRTGEVYADSDVVGLSAAIERLGDPSVRALCGENGRTAIRNGYNWEADAGRMIAALEDLLGAARR
jgi:glycosyltransferase involved in cell wall biosynthesis